MNLLYPAAAAAVFATDTYLKNRVERELPEGQVKELANGRIRLRKLHNHGFSMGILSKHPRFIAFISLTMTIGATLLFLLTLGKKGNTLLKMALSLLVGGAFCNTYDRLKRHYVIDYLSFQVKWKRFANIVFNLSDFAIIIGALLLILQGENSTD
jgi:signal peptidase II